MWPAPERAAQPGQADTRGGDRPAPHPL